MDQHRIVHDIPCKDVVDRSRTLQVFATAGRLALVAPAGGVAYVHPRDYERLRQAMRDSLTEAYKQLPAHPERRPAAEAGSTVEPSQLTRGGSAGVEVESPESGHSRGNSLGPHIDPNGAS